MAAKANVHKHIVFCTQNIVKYLHSPHRKLSAVRRRCEVLANLTEPLAAMAISNFDMWASEPTSTSRSGQHVAVILGLAVVCATVLLYIIVSSLSRPMPANSMPRPRRTSSNLVEDPRGDTGVPSMASVLAEKPRKDLNVPSVRLTPIEELSGS